MRRQSSPLAISLLAAAIGTSLFLPAARAQEAQSQTAAQDAPTEPAAKSLDSVKVTSSYQKSLITALDDKRKDARVVDSISSEDIGKFPAENIAEAIQHIPGVQMQEINGRGATISIRGLGPEYAATTINGQQIMSSDFTGGFRFDIIQPEIAKSIQVIKSPSADMDAGGLSGTINIDTIKPLDYQERKLVVSGKGQESEYRDGGLTPKIVGTYIDQFFDGTLGVFLNAGYQELEDRADYLWIDRWTTATDENGNTLNVPVRPRYRRIDRDTRRKMLNGGIQWRPSDNIEAGLTMLHSEDRTQNYMYQQVFLLNSGAINVLEQNGDYATRVSADGFTLENNYQYENHDWQTDLFTGYLDWSNENWNVRGTANYTQGETKEYEAAAITGRIVSNATLDILNSGSFTVADDLSDPSLYQLGSLTRNTYPGGAIKHTTDTQKSFQLDADRWLGMKWMNSLKLGGKYSTETLDRMVWRHDFYALATDEQTDVGYPALSDAYVLVSGFLNGNSGIQNAWASPDSRVYQQYLDASGYVIPDLFVPKSSYSVKHDISALYAMGTIETTLGGIPLRGNYGARYMRTERTVDGYIAGPSVIDVQNNPGTLIGYTRDKYSYNNFLPSLNMVLELRPDLLLRFSAAKVMVQPVLNSDTSLSTTVSGSANSLGTTTYSVNIGQPDMKPLTAKQADLGLEWYYTQSSALTANFFYKAIKNGTYSYTLCPDTYDGTPLSMGAGGDCVDSTGNIYEISATKNDPSTAKIKGYELAWTQSLDQWLPIRGFGLSANFTRVIPDYPGTGYRVRNLSEKTWNFTGFYENHGISARAIVNHRSKYYQGSQDSFFAYAGHEVEERTQLDLMFGYAPTDRLSFTVGILNANNTSEHAYYNSPSIWQESSYVGRSVYAGFEWKIL